MNSRERLETDWYTVEQVLVQVGMGASEPLYSRVENAKAALYRLGSAAVDSVEDGDRDSWQRLAYHYQSLLGERGLL